MTERFVIKYKNCDSNLDILQKIFSSYVKENNLKVKRGDLVIMLPVETEDDVKNENYKIYDDYDEIYPSNGRSAGWCCSGGKKPFHTGKGTRAKVANIAKGLKSQPKLK